MIHFLRFFLFCYLFLYRALVFVFCWKWGLERDVYTQFICWFYLCIRIQLYISSMAAKPIRKYLIKRIFYVFFFWPLRDELSVYTDKCFLCAAHKRMQYRMRLLTLMSHTHWRFWCCRLMPLTETVSASKCNLMASIRKSEWISPFGWPPSNDSNWPRNRQLHSHRMRT